MFLLFGDHRKEPRPVLALSSEISRTKKPGPAHWVSLEIYISY